MKIQISHQDAAKILSCYGQTVWVDGFGYRIDPHAESEAALEVTDYGDGWRRSRRTLLELFRSSAIYIEGPELPSLPDGYRWGGDNPMHPSQVDKVSRSNFGPPSTVVTPGAVSTYCVTATDQIQRDIARAVADLWDQQHPKSP